MRWAMEFYSRLFIEEQMDHPSIADDLLPQLLSAECEALSSPFLEEEIR